MSKTTTAKLETERLNFERNELSIKNSGLIYLGAKYRKLIYLCPVCKNTMLIKRKALVKNPICRNCMTGQSFGEEKTIELLNKRNIKYEKEKTFKGLKGLNNGKLRFDFYIYGSRRNFILEIDGEQHNSNEWSNNTITHDQIKNKFCLDNNIKLYRIKYKFGKLKRLENDIENILESEAT